MNVKVFLILSVLLVSAAEAGAQSALDRVLDEIERNSLSLKAGEKRAEAQRAAAATDGVLDAPEVGVNYLLGSPSGIGDRVDVSVSQAFDFPTAYAQRSKLRRSRSVSADLEYAGKRSDLLREAGGLCITMAYYNGVVGLYEDCLAESRSVMAAMDKAFERGEVSAVEQRKAKVAVAGMLNKLADLKVERERTLAGLSALNGGVAPGLADSLDLRSIQCEKFPFDEAKSLSAADSVDVGESPYVRLQMSKLRESELETKLQKSLNLPRFSVGYMSEKTNEEHYQGVALSVVLPIWGAGKRVRQAKAESLAVRLEADDVAVSLRTRLGSLLSLRRAYAAQLGEVGGLLSSGDYLPLVRKSLDAGELTVFGYYTEVSSSMETAVAYEEALRDYCLLSFEYESLLP